MTIAKVFFFCSATYHIRQVFFLLRHQRLCNLLSTVIKRKFLPSRTKYPMWEGGGGKIIVLYLTNLKLNPKQNSYSYFKQIYKFYSLLFDSFVMFIVCSSFFMLQMNRELITVEEAKEQVTESLASLTQKNVQLEFVVFILSTVFSCSIRCLFDSHKTMNSLLPPHLTSVCIARCVFILSVYSQMCVYLL